MPQQIECEEKFFCSLSPALFQFIEKELQFKFQKKVKETDIYFKDKNLKYLQPNTCLRLRTNNTPFCELTRKKVVGNDTCVKIEKNFSFPQTKLVRLMSLLHRIEVEKYCTVFKERFIYTKEKNCITYNIMIDILNNQYTFIELEILSHTHNALFLKQKLNDFISLFKNFNFQKAKQNYREFSKEHINQDIIK